MSVNPWQTLYHCWLFKFRFVFLFLFAFTFVYSLIAAVILSVKNYRNSFLLLYISPERPLLRKKLLRILNLSGFGDWMMLYLIARNTDRVVFGQVCCHIQIWIRFWSSSYPILNQCIMSKKITWQSEQFVASGKNCVFTTNFNSNYILV